LPKHEVVIRECEASQMKFIWPKKDELLKLMMQSPCFFFQERCKTGINWIVLFLWQFIQSPPLDCESNSNLIF
jgi:hypothetical protein